MRCITYIGKTITCPKFEYEITLRGKYHLYNPDTSEAKFLYAECPIVENEKLPYSKQNKDFALHRCQGIGSCKELENFKTIIDLRKDGYSQ